MTHIDVERIHEASLSLLEDPGVRIEHEGVFARLVKAGAKPGREPLVARLSGEMVAEWLRRAPAQVHFADRKSGGYAIDPVGRARAWSCPGMNLLRRGKRRPFTSADMADAARLLDRLDNVDGVFGMALDDVPPGARDVVGLRVMAENTRKHIRVLSFTPAGADALCRMRPVLGDIPWFSVGFTAHGPLRWTNLALEIFARTAGHGIPVTVNGEPMAGASGPVTLAGAAAVGNAEILAGIVVNQVLEPGRPCVHNLGLAHVLDMRTAIAVTGAPENALLAAIGAALGRFYNLPSCSWVSTESMCVDSQAATEKALGFREHLSAGVSLVWGVGQLESELTFSPAQAVIDDEILAACRRYDRGVPVSDEDLALDAVRRVGIAGSFLDDEHTLGHFRDELWEPGISWRNRRGVWEQAGSPRLDEAAEARVDELISAPSEPSLSPDQQKELRRIESDFLRSLP